MNYYALLPLFSFIANILLGFYIIYIDYKATENRLFFLLTLSVAFWSILHFFMFSAENVSEALFWGRFDTWTSTFGSLLVLHFLIVYTKFKISGIKKYVILFLYVLVVIFGLLDQETLLIERVPVLHFWGYFSAPGSLYIFPTIFVIGCIIAGLLFTMNFYIKSRSENEKKQALLLIIAISIPLIGGIFTEGLLAFFGVEVMPMTTTLLTVMAIIIAYTIRKYKLMIPLEYELKRIKEDYKKLFVTFNALPDSIVLLTEEGRILETNRAMEVNFASSDKRLIGKNLYNLLPKKVSDKRKSLALKAAQSGTTQENEDITMNRHFHNLFIPTESAGGVNDILIVSKDITEQRKAEEEKKEMERQVQQSQKLKALGTMAGGMAHDFKNILTPILGFSNLALKKINSSDSSYIYVEEINKAAKRAKEIIDQILRFSRESQKKLKPIYLHTIIEEAIKLIKFIIPSNIKINEKIDASCDKVLADVTQIHEVITNLCTNAIHAMEEKGGILEIRMKQIQINKDMVSKNKDLKEQQYVQIVVSDTGIGMTKEIKERIFDPFFTTKEVDKGTGLGLSVVHGIIKDHKGAITVSSKKSEGSVFTVYLPVYKKTA